ncbi:MAG: hypothetical protein ACU4F9_07740 [Arcticibacter sp.]
MNTLRQIENYIASQSEPKRSDLDILHKSICNLLPNGRLWFLDGKDESGKTIANPNIGYGLQELRYANGKSKEFYQIGLSANTTGISVYIMGLADKKYLLNTYGKVLGKATVTGYCIKFKALKNINVDILLSAISDGLRLPTSG